MDDTIVRLGKCFLMVFPNLAPESIEQASAETIGSWDSVAQITLLGVIGEEFGIDVDYEEFEGASSFPTILDRVRSRVTSV